MKSCASAVSAARADRSRRHPLPAVGDIVGHRIVEQKSVLRHQADLIAQTCQAETRARPPVDPDAPRRGVVEARHQVGDRGLPPAARTHQRHHFAGLHFQVQALETEAIWRAGIVEADVLENNAVLETGEPRSARRIHHGLLVVQIFEHLLRCAQRLLEDVVDPHQALQWFQQHQQCRKKTGEVPAVNVPPLICKRA